MENPLDRFRESLNSWAGIVQANTEQRIAKALFVSILNTSSVGGAFSGWLLAISGATIGLLFSQLESVTKILAASELKLALVFLFCSCAAGFVARVVVSLVELNRSLLAELEPVMESILREHDVEEEKIKRTAGVLVPPPELQPDMEKAFSQVLECLPRPHRWLAMRGFVRGKTDPLFAYKRATKLYLGQGLIVLVQVIFFALFAGTVFVAL